MGDLVPFPVGRKARAQRVKTPTPAPAPAGVETCATDGITFTITRVSGFYDDVTVPYRPPPTG